MGRRVKKAVYAYGSGAWELQKEILFVYDGWNLIQEKEVSGTGDPLFDKFYVWGLDLSQSIQGAGGIGGLVCRVSRGEVRHYFYDANGNVEQMVNTADGAITAQYEYDAFGNLTGSYGDAAEGNTFRFSTKYFDGETGLYYYGYRYYSAELGRWIRRDPIEEEASESSKSIKLNRFMIRKKVQNHPAENLYLFSENSPISLVDYLGLKSVAYCDFTALGAGPMVVAVLDCTIYSMVCLKNIREYAEYMGVFFGVGVGSPAAKTYFSLTFPNSDVRTFSGSAHIYVSGAALMPGASLGETCLGRACSRGWGFQVGIDLGTDYLWGRGYIGMIQSECCDERAWRD